MGGRLDVESEAGRGSTFRFTLPTGQAPASLAAPAATPSAATSPSVARHVLVVEDNPVNLRLVDAILRKAGHTVVAARTGVQALDALERERFDIVLMDVQMPEMNGIETTEAIRARERAIAADRTAAPSASTYATAPPGGIVIVAMTAHAMDHDRDSCLQAGMNYFVGKPISRAELMKVIDSVDVATPTLR